MKKQLNVKYDMLTIFNYTNEQEDVINIAFCRVDSRTIHLSGNVLRLQDIPRQEAYKAYSDEQKILKLIASNLGQECDTFMHTFQGTGDRPADRTISTYYTFSVYNLKCNRTDDEIKKVFEDYYAQ